jgi:SNF2 family DNA or RNA helicase
MAKSFLNRYEKWLKLAKLDSKAYQKEAVIWCLQKEQSEISGGILADEMGLGKTYIMMGLIAADPKQTLIVVPPALLSQWTRVLTQNLHPPLVFHGPKRKNNFNFSPIILTTYNLTERKEIKEHNWERIIYDEAHHLRNKKSKKHRSALALKTKISWLVTGTPIQNRTADLFSLCNILKIPKSLRVVETICKDFCLRRRKEDVGLQLPELEIHNIFPEWKTAREKEFALDIHSLVKLTRVTGRNVNRRILGLDRVIRYQLPAILRARQVCIFPDLIKNGLQKYIDDGILDEDWATDISSFSSSKLDAITTTILNRNNGRKKLVFCHFRKEIDELSERFRHMKVGIIDGRTAKKERQNILNHSSFTQDLCNEITDKFVPNQGTDFIFKNIADYLTHDIVFLQIQTCCEGLNLQQFQEIYFTMPHWNPAVEDQAIARCYRQGQKHKVDVFKFYMKFSQNRTSLDEYCQYIQEKKRELHI